jgi:hypothetical protein
LQLAELPEGALTGALVGVEAALEALEAVFEVKEGRAEGEFTAADVVWVVRVEAAAVVRIEGALPELGLDAIEAADLPFIADDGVDKVPLARSDRTELGVIFGGELGEGLGIFAANDVGFGMKAGFQGVHARGGFAGVGAGTGGVLRIQTICCNLAVGCHLEPFCAFGATAQAMGLRYRRYHERGWTPKCDFRNERKEAEYIFLNGLTTLSEPSRRRVQESGLSFSEMARCVQTHIPHLIRRATNGQRFRCHHRGAL